MLVGPPLIFFRPSKVLGGGGGCGGLRYCALHKSRSPYPQYMLVAWAGYVRNAMLCLCVYTRHARGDDTKAPVIIVYIRTVHILNVNVDGLNVLADD